MAESCENLRMIDDEILTACVLSALHSGNAEEKGTLLKYEQETRMAVNLFSRCSIQELTAELCRLIEFVLQYDSRNRSKRDRNSPSNEDCLETEKKDTKRLDTEAVFSKYLDRSKAKVKDGNSLLGDRDPRCLSKSHFSGYSKGRSEISAAYKPNWKQNEKRTRPYPAPWRRESSSNGISSGKSINPVSDHYEQSNPTCTLKFNKKSESNNGIDRYGRGREDHIQDLIFKFYKEPLTLEDLLRCKTQELYNPSSRSCLSRNVLDQLLLCASSPPRFVQKYTSHAVDKPDVCLKIPDQFSVSEGGDHKEELFDALHVPYFEEKRGVAKKLDELLSVKLSNRINFI